jgi:hypothetical protein
MRIGVISEGHADRAVITNILTGLVGIDSSDIEPLRPIDKKDETDKAISNPLSFGGWTAVKEECETRKLIDDFLAIEGQDFIIIHIDTTEADQYGVTRPNKSEPDYNFELRKRVIDEINKWLKKDLSNELLYAISIEEIDAWILTIYDPRDSTKAAQPKEKLSRVLGKLNIDSTSNYENYLSISKPLSKPRDIRKGKFLDYNDSLSAFFEEIHTKILSKKTPE